MNEGNPPYRLGSQIRIRYLEGHPNGQRQVGKVQICRGVIFIEIDSAYRPGIEAARVAQREHRMDYRPRQRHAQYSQCNQVGLGSTDCLTSSDEDQSNSREQSDPEERTTSSDSRMLWSSLLA